MSYRFHKTDFQKKLEEKGAVKPCHRCGHNSFSVLDGVSKIQLDLNFDPTSIHIGGGMQMPVGYIVCNNCAAVTMHALGGLGLFDLTSKNKEG